VSPSLDNWVLVAVVNKDVVDVVEVDLVFIHVSQAEEKWGVRRHDSKENSAERGSDFNISDRDTLWIISESNSVTSRR
jgi:hypothetical protein